MIIRIIYQSSNLLIYYRRKCNQYAGRLISYGLSNCHNTFVYTIQRSEFVLDWDANKYTDRRFELWSVKEEKLKKIRDD